VSPVLVAGAGPVGLCTALLLARWDVPTVVLEAQPEHRPVGSRSICVQRDVLDIYHRVGVADALMAEGVTWHRGRTFFRDHELFTITFPDPGRSAYPGFINIGQSSVERELVRAVRAQPLVDLRYGHTVTGVRQDRASVTARASTAGGPVELTGTHLVAADGPRSAVRELLGLDFAGHSFGDRFLIADIRVNLPFGAERRFHFDPEWNPGRQVLVHPQPHSVWRIDWQVPADYDLAADRAGGGLDARIRRVTGDTPYEIVWLSVYRFHQRLASRMAVGRVLLAGDAAHLMAPFGARGLNSGVQDAENAAWKIAFDRRGWAGPALLDSYEQERRAAAAENLRVTGETMRFLAPATPAQWAWRRDVLRRAVTDPAARAQVDSGKLAEPFWYLDSPLTTGDRPPGFPIGPGQARPPVAGVLCPDAPVRLGGAATRLRELIGTGFTALGYGVRLRPETLDVPVSAFLLEEIDDDGVLADALDARPQRSWLLRPDGHLAAVLDGADPGAFRAALDRARGRLSNGQ
jgi:2-polyprenyl-6-methoxyphenol hydroxylase-like FAD-dependent oxidoreductase